MRGIKHVLTERQYVWEDAVKLAESDPEIDLSGNGPAFTPTEFLEEIEEMAEEEEAAEAAEDAVNETAGDEQQSLKEPAAAVPATPMPAEPKTQNEAPRL